MKEHPILMRSDMVNAILNGKKRQTRRPVKFTYAGHVKEPGGHRRWHPSDLDAALACPYGTLGDRLWVKETWRPWNDPALWDVVQYRADMKIIKPKITDENQGYWFHEQCEATISDQVDGVHTRWRPSIFMPRWASRINLEVTGIRIERINDISEQDARAEGFAVGSNPTGGGGMPGSPRNNCDVFRAYYETIHGEGTWNKNPWVWVINFKKVPASVAETATSPK